MQIFQKRAWEKRLRASVSVAVLCCALPHSAPAEIGDFQPAPQVELPPFNPVILHPPADALPWNIPQANKSAPKRFHKQKPSLALKNHAHHHIVAALKPKSHHSKTVALLDAKALQPVLLHPPREMPAPEAAMQVQQNLSGENSGVPVVNASAGSMASATVQNGAGSDSTGNDIVKLRAPVSAPLPWLVASALVVPQNVAVEPVPSESAEIEPLRIVAAAQAEPAPLVVSQAVQQALNDAPVIYGKPEARAAHSEAVSDAPILKPPTTQIALVEPQPQSAAPGNVQANNVFGDYVAWRDEKEGEHETASAGEHITLTPPSSDIVAQEAPPYATTNREVVATPALETKTTIDKIEIAAQQTIEPVLTATEPESLAKLAPAAGEPTVLMSPGVPQPTAQAVITEQPLAPLPTLSLSPSNLPPSNLPVSNTAGSVIVQSPVPVPPSTQPVIVQSPPPVILQAPPAPAAIISPIAGEADVMNPHSQHTGNAFAGHSPNTISPTISALPDTPLSAETKGILERLPPEPRPSKKPLKNIDLQRGARNTKEDDIKKHEAYGMKIAVKRPKMDVFRALESAYNALIAGDQTYAITQYKEVLDEDPENTMALFGLATTYHRAGQIQLARPLYAQLLEMDPQNVEGLNNFLVLLAEESPKEALVELAKLQQTHPSFSPVPAQMALIYEKEGDYSKAAEYMARALALSPENLKYQYDMAIIYDKMGDSEEAAKWYQRLLTAASLGEKIPGDTQEIQQRLTFIRSNTGSPH